MSTRLAESLDKDLEQLGAEIKRLRGKHAEEYAAAEKIVADIRASGVNPLLDRDAFEKVDEAYKIPDSTNEEISQLEQRRERVMSMMGRTPTSEAAVRKLVRGWDGAAQALWESPIYQRLREANAFHSEGARIEIPPIEVFSRDEAMRFLKSGGAVRHATADVDAIVPTDQRLFPPVPIPVRMVTVTEMVTQATTDTDTIEYVEETTRTDAAAETAPGTGSSEATYVYTARTANVRDISHWTPAHKRNLADAGQVRALLEGRLASGVDRRLETQIVNGDGVGQNLKGILQTTGRGSVTKGGTEPRLEAIHRGITNVRLNLFAEPTGIGLHPTDYEETVFEKDANGAYLLGPASQQTSRTVWGFPAIVTAAFPNGTGVVGHFLEGAVLWLRSGIAISASDSHSTFFIERRVAIMAELRAAFAAWQPKAFCEVLSI